MDLLLDDLIVKYSVRKANTMKINLAKSAGFCFGVKRAIDIAYKTLARNKNVCMLGDIVHNEEVIKKPFV